MGCPRSTTLAAALLYLAYYLRCCVKDLAVRSPAVGALAAHRMPAYLYRSNNDTKLLAHLARAATAGADEPAFLAPACAAGPPSFNALVKARMARDRRPVLAALTDKRLVKRWAALRGVRTPEVLFSSKTCAVPEIGADAYAFKATHTTGCLVLVEGGRVVGHKPCGERRLAPGSRVTPELLATLCARWTRTMYDVTQWAYSKLTPGVVAERLVYRGDGATPADDVKCFAFRGRTALVQHVAHRFDVQSGRGRRGSATRSTTRARGAASPWPWTASPRAPASRRRASVRPGRCATASRGGSTSRASTSSTRAHRSSSAR